MFVSLGVEDISIFPGVVSLGIYSVVVLGVPGLLALWVPGDVVHGIPSDVASVFPDLVSLGSAISVPS